MTQRRPLPERPGSTNGDKRAWNDFESALAAALEAFLSDGGPGHLVLEVPGGSPDDDGCPPYAQFASYADGTMLRAEICGDHHLSEPYRLGAAEDEAMRLRGWAGNDTNEANWHRAIDAGHDAEPELAAEVVRALRDTFGLAHPHLLVYRAGGAAEVAALLLGLADSGDVPHDSPAPAASVFSSLVHTPADHDDLMELVGAVLSERFEEQATVDDDGDLRLNLGGRYLWVRVHESRPIVEVFAQAVHDVRSRRDAAVEAGLLNRDHPWVKWDVRDRSVWQSIVVPAAPFVPSHLSWAISTFLDAFVATCPDLALRLHGKVG